MQRRSFNVVKSFLLALEKSSACGVILKEDYFCFVSNAELKIEHYVLLTIRGSRFAIFIPRDDATFRYLATATPCCTQLLTFTSSSQPRPLGVITIYIYI
jgi:hypothetical protein